MAKMIQAPYKTKRYFTNDDNANLIYFQFPKLLMYGEQYKKMSADGKLFYMLCLDLIKLSMKRGWKDEYGRYYIKMSLETIKDRMNCAKPKAVNLKKELIQFELMEAVRIGQGKADRLYILQLDYNEEDIYKANNDHEDIENDEYGFLETPETLESQEKSQNLTSRSKKIKPLEVTKDDPIKNNTIKNNELRRNIKNLYKDNIDDDKRTFPLAGKDSAIHNDEYINLIISNFRESTKNDLSSKSFNTLIRKVVDKYNQGKIGKGKFRDYLSSAIANKIDELELRRAKDEAKQKLKANSKERIQQKKQELEQQPIKNTIPFYNWLKE